MTNSAGSRISQTQGTNPQVRASTYYLPNFPQKLYKNKIKNKRNRTLRVAMRFPTWIRQWLNKSRKTLNATIKWLYEHKWTSQMLIRESFSKKLHDTKLTLHTFTAEQWTILAWFESSQFKNWWNEVKALKSVTKYYVVTFKFIFESTENVQKLNLSCKPTFAKNWIRHKIKIPSLMT